MTANEATFWVSIIALAVACIGYAVTATWQLGRVEGRLNEKMRTAIENLRREVEADATARDAVASRARHDHAGQVDRTFMEIRQSMKEINDRHFALDREAIRKVDLVPFETRLTAALAAHETRLTTQIGKLEQRLDNWAEQLHKN